MLRVTYKFDILYLLLFKLILTFLHTLYILLVVHNYLVNSIKSLKGKIPKSY